MKVLLDENLSYELRHSRNGQRHHHNYFLEISDLGALISLIVTTVFGRRGIGPGRGLILGGAIMMLIVWTPVAVVRF